jgi:hypothetical protein
MEDAPRWYPARPPRGRDRSNRHRSIGGGLSERIPLFGSEAAAANIGCVSRFLPLRLPTFLAVLALAGWLRASTEALGHRHAHDHDHEKECPTCVVAAQSAEVVHDAPVLGANSSGTWREGCAFSTVPEAADVPACARGPPTPTLPRS